MSQHDQFTTGQVESAIKDFLKFGEDQNGIGHKGYFSGSGWAANCLRSHLAALSATQPAQAAQSETCPTCGESEPYSGACGTSASDTRALCKRKAQAAQGAGEVVATCPNCEGSGEVTEASDSSPDAHEITVACPHCKGTGALEDAYSGVVELLKQATEKWYQALPYMVAHRNKSQGLPPPSLLAADAAQPAPVVPEGWKLVPVEPTREMMDAMPGLPAIGAAGDMDLKNLGWSLKEIQNRHRWMGAIAATPTPPAQAAADARDACPDDLRSWGWSVAVHNDYRLSGEAHTFWLFTKDGQAVKGEGRTDAEALNQVRAALATHQQGGSK